MPAHRTKENQGIVATESRYTMEGMARGKKKRKSPPKKKAPNKKRETAACGSACLRAAAPPSSLASFLSSFGGCAASLSPALSWVAGAAPSSLSYTMKSRLSETHMGIGVPLSPDCENQRFSCQGLLRSSLSEACFVTVTSHKLICSPLDFASARHPKGPLSKATGFLHILP